MIVASAHRRSWINRWRELSRSARVSRLEGVLQDDSRVLSSLLRYFRSRQRRAVRFPTIVCFFFPRVDHSPRRRRPFPLVDRRLPILVDWLSSSSKADLLFLVVCPRLPSASTFSSAQRLTSTVIRRLSLTSKQCYLPTLLPGSFIVGSTGPADDRLLSPPFRLVYWTWF